MDRATKEEALVPGTVLVMKGEDVMRPYEDKYPFIWAWGAYMASYPYYMEGECRRAESDKAPPGAIYYDRSHLRWVCVDEVKNNDLRRHLITYVRGRFPDHPIFTADLEPPPDTEGKIINPEHKEDRGGEKA